MNRLKKFSLAFTITSLVAVLAIPATAGAVTATSKIRTTAEVSTARITLIKTRADQEIQRRITALNHLGNRIEAMAKVSDADKTTLSGEIQSQITTLTSLQTKIDADTDVTTLKADQLSITKSYRIFILIIPQGAIIAAVDRIDTVTALMTTLAGKLGDRITQAQTDGNDTTKLAASLTDYSAKVEDANAQAQAALTEVASLVPDNGDTTTQQSNTAALKDARAKIKTATQDLQAARKDASSIVSGLKSFQIKSGPVPTAPTTNQ